jgi:hypothetical protein
MNDYFEIDFLDVESPKSGDAIALRYHLSGTTYIHVVDAGFQDTGPSFVNHIRRFYSSPTHIHHVVATHPDGDHAGGLRTVLESFDVGTLWMLRPWQYAATLLPLFPTYSSASALASRLRSIYSNIAALEDIALARGIPIQEPFQGQWIGAFRVLAPSPARYVQLLVTSDRTPETVGGHAPLGLLGRGIGEALARLKNLVKGAWGHEIFSPNETSAENEMSIVQHGVLCGQRILLTADAGRSALTEAADYATATGIVLPGVDRFQVPHHGSRRNVSTEVLDRWLGPRRNQPGIPATFTAICSSAKLDEDHPRKSVKRAIIHRGGNFYATEGINIVSYGGAAPSRPGYGPLTASAYPDEQEE